MKFTGQHNISGYKNGKKNYKLPNWYSKKTNWYSQWKHIFASIYKAAFLNVQTDWREQLHKKTLIGLFKTTVDNC